MLRTMRNDFKKYSWTLWLVIIAFLLGFSFTDIFSGGNVSKTVIAKIGDNEINVETFQKQLFRVIDNYKNQMKGNFNKALITQMRIPEQILQNLINSEIIQAEAAKLNLKATKGELKNKIVTFPAFQKDGKFIGISEYKRYLAIFRTNAKDFEKDLKKDIVNDKLKNLITASLVVDGSVLKDKYKKENDSADVDFIKLKITTKKTDFSASDEEISKYYENNKENFMTPEMRKGEIIALKFDDYRKELKIGEIDLYNYFKNNKDKFKTPEKTRISRIFIKYEEPDRENVYKKIQKLKEKLNVSNFESQAKLYSTDNKKDVGGDWGYSEWKNFTSQEQTIIKSLRQGEISDPVDTLSGFSILYAKEKTNEMQEPYETAKPKIKNVLEREELKKIVFTKLDKIYKKVKSNGILSVSDDKNGIKAIETKYLASGDGIKDIDQFGYISRKLFTMNENEIDYPVEFMDGIAIVKLTSIKEPETEPLLSIKEKVKDFVLKEKQLNELIAKSGSLVSELNKIGKKEKLENYLKKKGMKLENTAYSRGNKLSYIGKYQELDKLVFGSKEGVFLNPVRIGDSVVILRANNIKVSTDDDFMREKDSFYTKKLNELRDNYFISYIINKRVKYNVGVNRELFEKVRESVVSRFN